MIYMAHNETREKGKFMKYLIVLIAAGICFWIMGPFGAMVPILIWWLVDGRKTNHPN